ncbi:MAG: alpha/beta hydrolase [Pseudomonadales bacterium]
MTGLERILDNHGCKIWTTSTGDGSPVIMINGGPGCDDYLGEVAGLIDDTCQVVRFEPRGCGRSDYDGNYDFATMVSDIEFVRESHGFERIILVGHSFGCDIALAYTMFNPGRVAGLIGIAGGRIVNDRDWHADYKRNKTGRGEVNPIEFTADPRVNEIGNQTYKEYLKRRDLLIDIATLAVPATYIAASQDIRPNWPIKQLAALMQARYVEIEGAAHWIWLTHPDELQQALRQAISAMSP